MVPEVWGVVQGHVTVGGSLYAVVDIQGTMIDTKLPLLLSQDYGQWPLSARYV